MAPRLKFLTGSNPRLNPLKDGTVKVEGYEIEFSEPPGGSFNLFQHNLHTDDFEVSEMSMSESMIARERRHTFGGGRWDWAYIPNFLGRGFNWDRICVLPGSNIKSPADLKGKRVAVGDYSMTSILWFRAMLKDLYGIEASDISWYNLRDRGKETGLDKDPPKGVAITWLPQDADPVEMLEKGAYDAVHGVNNAVVSSGRAQLLFQDGAEKLVIEHYQKNGSEHANHHYVIQKRILDEHPGVALALYDALEKSRQVAIERAGKDSNVYKYFDDMSPDTQDSIFGSQPYGSGVKANRRTIQRLLDGAIEQGLITKPQTVEEFYPAEVLTT